jgi:hypothetical protein
MGKANTRGTTGATGMVEGHLDIPKSVAGNFWHHAEIFSGTEF